MKKFTIFSCTRNYLSHFPFMYIFLLKGLSILLNYFVSICMQIFLLKNIYLPLQIVSFRMHAFDQDTLCIYCSLCLMLNGFLDPKRMISKLLKAV